jgi:hypothetical protein
MSTIAPGAGSLAGEVIREESRLILKTHDANHITEDFLRSFVRELTGRYNRLDLAPPLEIILKELTTNAAKANFKKIFFAENGLLMEDPVQYEEGIVKFRQIFSEDMFAEYALKAREARLDVTTIFDFDDDRFAIEIRNNVPMSSAEEKRVRDKLAIAMRCDNAGEFISCSASRRCVRFRLTRAIFQLLPICRATRWLVSWCHCTANIAPTATAGKKNKLSAGDDTAVGLAYSLKRNQVHLR